MKQGEEERGVQGGTYMFLFQQKQNLMVTLLMVRSFPKKRKIRGESFLYKYLTCIAPIKSTIMHTRSTNIPIHCRAPLMHPIH